MLVFRFHLKLVHFQLIQMRLRRLLEFVHPEFVPQRTGLLMLNTSAPMILKAGHLKLLPAQRCISDRNNSRHLFHTVEIFGDVVNRGRGGTFGEIKCRVIG